MIMGRSTMNKDLRGGHLCSHLCPMLGASTTMDVIFIREMRALKTSLRL